jgi:hypothetical protein
MGKGSGKNTAATTATAPGGGGRGRAAPEAAPGSEVPAWKAAGFVSETHQRMFEDIEKMYGLPRAASPAARKARGNRIKKAEQAMRRHIGAVERQARSELDRRQLANVAAATRTARLARGG